MTLIDFMDQHWFVTIVVCGMVYGVLVAFLNFWSIMHNRFWRHWNIRKHGWPPEHCDADGDLRTVEKEVESE